ncbi:MAG: ATP-binding protein [Oscillospiraceae bacterium]|nr:ATP-binding protein [Oscillospiraceae bacterium]
MHRHAMSELIKWKNEPGRKPLLLRGARQVGKTWLMKEFGRSHFKKTAYINFDENRSMEELFSGSLDISRIVAFLQIETGVVITPEDTLLIFDEVQEVPRALTSLKYFNENAPQYAIIAAGSMLGVALHQGTSFPVGKVEFLDLHPMSFTEFLEAIELERYADLLTNAELDIELINAFKSTYIDALRQYYYIGGMPEAVSAFVDRGDYSEVRAIQNRILSAYEQDFSKYAPNETVPRIRMLWNSIVPQLSRENRKFVYGHIREGARAREYELAMQWLLDCGLIHRVNRITKPGIPPMAYVDMSAFKLYMVDVGLMSAKADLDIKTVINGNSVFQEFKGALTEQYILQQLVSECNIRPFYWTAERATAEVDFVFMHDGNVYPLEVKAEENLKSKSLKQYHDKYSPEISIRTSMSDYRRESWLVNLPLYAICSIGAIVELH